VYICKLSIGFVFVNSTYTGIQKNVRSDRNELCCSRTEGDRVGRGLGRRAGEQRIDVVVRIGVSGRAVIVEEGILRNARRGAGRRRVEASAAAVRRVCSPPVKRVDQASRLAADGEPGRVERTLELTRADGSQVDVALAHGTSDVVADPDGQVVAVDERDIIEVGPASVEVKFGKRSWGNAGSSRGVTEQASVAASVDARVWARIDGEVAVAATPDTAVPLVGNGESYGRERGSGPSGCLRRTTASGSKQSRPHRERASVEDGNRTRRGDGGERKGGGDGSKQHKPRLFKESRLSQPHDASSICRSRAF